ncbi:MAG: response regulator [Prevotella sp.]|nr:response regulator [Prevotella sp.]
MKMKYIIITILSALTLQVNAQRLAVSKHIGIEEGLSNNFVQDIVIDKRGSVWVGTESGLNCISGNTINIFRSREMGNGQGTINTNSVRSLYYDEVNDKVMAATEKGLNIYDCSKRRMYNINAWEEQNMPTINDITKADGNSVWLATAKGDIFKMDCNSHKVEMIKKNLGNVRTIMDDNEGHLYMGHHLIYGMSILNVKSSTVKNYRHSDAPYSLPGNNVRCIYQDHLKNIWVGTNMGLALFDPKTERFYKVESRYDRADDNVFDIYEMPGGQLWVASDMGGINIVDLAMVSSGRTIYYDNQEQVVLSSINTRSIRRDSFGNIWVGNYSTGIDFIAATKQDFHILENYDANHIMKRTYGLTSDADGNVWIGGEDELQVANNGKVTDHWSLNGIMNRSHSFIMCLMADSQDNVWLGVEDDGVIKFNRKSGKMERIDIGHPVSDVRAFYEDSKGRIWIGTEFGIYTYENGTLTKSVIGKDVLNNTVAFCFLEYGNYMLIGSYGKGLAIFNHDNGKLRLLNTAEGLPSNIINHMLKDHLGGLWLATPMGLCYIKDIRKPQNIITYNHQNGLDDDHIRAIQEDRSGTIWVSTYSGIARFDKEKETFYNFNHLDNISSGSFIYGSATTTPDGTMYFGSPTGVCYFNSQQLDYNAVASEVRIVSCEAYNPAGEDMEILNLIPNNDRQVKANYLQNTLHITFAVKDYSQNNDVEYSYMMKGMNDKWYYIGNDFDVVFRGLRPGDYTFILRAKLKNQDWDDASTTQFDIRITPPVWQTPLAYIIYILIAVAIIWFFFRSYRNKLRLENSLELEQQSNLQKQELNEERLRFFTNVTHELRTPLTLILGPLEDLVNDKSLPEQYRKKINLINNSASRLRNLINEILEFRKTETQNRRLTVAKGDLGELVKEIGNNFKQMNRKENVAIHVMVRPDIPPVYFDSEVITTILNNFLSNAIKYTQEGSIDLIMLMEDNWLNISVKDTGYGIDNKALPHIFDRYYQADGKHQASGTGIGLALVKSLAELHEGRLDVESKLGSGSKFTFSLLINNTYPNSLHKEDKEKENSLNKETEEAGTAIETDERPLLLVVEDNDDIRQYIADSMSNDFRIIQASNGYEGTMIAMEQIPDIIVSDIMMPRMNGIELTKRVKQDLRTSHIPIILLTAKDSIQDKEEGYDSGADSYLTKPFSAHLLLSRINNLLSTRRKLAELIMLKEGVVKQEPQTTITEVSTPRLSQLDQNFIEKMNLIIEENITKETLDMKFMTDKMAMSYSTFYRKVKALTGITANEYIRKRRLERCAQLLKSGKYNVTEAATMTGFNDLGNFRDVFKQEFGMSPSDYAKLK